MTTAKFLPRPVRLLIHALAIAFAVAIAFVISAPAQVAPAPAPSATDLAKYDRNRDGRLDAAELATQRADEARARAAAPAAAGASTTGEPVVELSPFEVSAAADTGYFASNTLSGTRLNSKIEDLASSITVVTKQQMEDTAALDINDIFLYEANTEGTGNFTDFSVGRNGDVNDSVQSSPTTSNRIRGIASANIARGNFASDSRIPVDTYNVDAVEISRGPNSNIFGLGNASGTVNLIQSQANLTREKSTLTLRADSYDGYRTSLDLNRPLYRDKLAVRVIGLYESTGYVRKPSKDITHRLQGLVSWRPFKNTTLRASYESYHNFARRPNFITPRDTTTYWNSVGRPTWDPTTFTAKVNGASIGTFTQAQDGTLPPGLLSQGTGFYNRPGMYVDNGAVAFWSVNRTSNTSNANNPNTNVRFLESGTDIMRNRGSTQPLFTTPGITDPALYDWTSINYVAPNYATKKADSYNIELEQFFLNTPVNLLALQAAFLREDVDNYSRNFISGNSSILFIDVNEKLLDGRPNPYFLRPYLGASEPTIFNSPSVNDNGRVQLAYQLNLEQATARWLHWLGRHRVSGYLEGRRITSGTYRYREVVLDDHSWINTANRANSAAAARAYFKYYLGDKTGQNIDYAPPALYGAAGKYSLNWYDGVTGQWVVEPAQFGETGVTPANRAQREIRSRGAVLQSFWFKDRIVTTVGTRRDRNRSRNSGGATVDATTGLVTYENLNTWGSWSEQQGTTRTRGIVVKPFRGWPALQTRAERGTGLGSWLADAFQSASFFYNTANTFQPASAQYNLFGDLLPNPTGEGKDYGINLALFKNKLSIRVGRYDNSQLNSRGGDAGIVATRANRIDFPQGGSDDSFNLRDLAYQWVAQLHPEYTVAQQDTEVAKIMGLPEGFIAKVQGKNVAETQDVSSRGWEFEINYNPTPNWTLKIAGAQQKTIDSNLSPNIQRYFDERLPVWEKVIDPTTGLNWWTSRYGSGGVPQAFYEGVVLAPYKLATANQGKPRSQVREWRWNTTTSYRLAGLGTDHGWLNRSVVGGSLRWEDRGSIGFLGAAPDADGVIRSLDRGKPVYDSSHTYFDLFVGHRVRLFRDKVSANFQLNVRNAFEGGRLQTIGVNPDGSGYNFRIIDPRQFIATATFEF